MPYVTMPLCPGSDGTRITTVAQCHTLSDRPSDRASCPTTDGCREEFRYLEQHYGTMTRLVSNRTLGQASALNSTESSTESTVVRSTRVI